MARKRAASPSNNVPNNGTTNDNNNTKNINMLPCEKACPKFGTAGIVCEDATGAPYACVLNQTNIAQNNNKYFVIQVIKDFSADHYYTWIHWGRVGYNGQNSLVDCGSDKAKAIVTFEKKFKEKTVNHWDDRHNFVKHSGKYDLVETELSNENEEKNDQDASQAATTVKNESEDSTGKSIAKKSKSGKSSNFGSSGDIKTVSSFGKQDTVPLPECKLETAVQNLIRLICDVKAMEVAAADVEFDTNKTPLGKISADQIRAGYSALSQISNILKESGAIISKRRQLTELSSMFYTRIPHFTGMRAPPVIDNENLLSTKIRMLEVLGDIKLGMDLLRQSSDNEKVSNQPVPIKVHPVDRLYQNLNCQIASLKRNSNEFYLLEKYILSTHATTHSSYTMTVEDLYEVNKDQHLPGFKGNQIGNRVLLFHGSRLSNWAGILSQGLRIAPPEAPVTGYMFGKGVYFADMSSKSANYCFATPSNPYGLLLMCEVALGHSNLLVNADYNAGTNLPAVSQSVKGCGRVAPQPQNFCNLSDGTLVPMGPGIEERTDLTLNYNEFIVYDTKQIRLRFLAKIKFNFVY